MTNAEQTRLATWRLKVLQRAGESSRTVARTCRHFGISRQAFYKWTKRYEAHGEAGPCDPPRTPHRSAGSTPRERLAFSPATLNGSARRRIGCTGCCGRRGVDGYTDAEIAAAVGFLESEGWADGSCFRWAALTGAATERSPILSLQSRGNYWITCGSP
jgi:hypothetical protein